MTKRASIPDTEEAWESGELGRTAEFVERLPDNLAEEALIDESLELQPISIRLEKSLIDDFKMIAAINNNIGYQPLMRQILKRFADCEKKRILREVATQARAKAAEAAKAAANAPATTKTRRAA